MSARPITVSEEIKAKAHPWVNILSLFGGTQGLLIYLHRQRIPFRSNWLASPGSPSRFAVFALGGYLVGGVIGMAAFSDWELLRLYARH